MKKKFSLFVLLSFLLVSGCTNNNNPSNSSSTNNDSSSSESTSSSVNSNTSSTSDDTIYDKISEIKNYNLGEKLEVKVVVNGKKGNDLYISDNSGSFFVYNKNALGNSNVGDEVVIKGEMGEFASAGIKQILPSSIEVVGKGNVTSPIVVTNLDNLDNYRFAPVKVENLNVTKKSINSSGDSFIDVTLNNSSIQLFVSKHITSKTDIDNYLNTIDVGEKITINGGFADYYKKPQIAITEVRQIELPNLSYEEKLAYVSKELESKLASINNQEIKRNIVLPTELSYGAIVNWTSDKPEYCTNQGIVNRPDVGESDVIVTLSYTITLDNQVSETKNIKITVLAKVENESIYDYYWVEPNYTGSYYNSIDENLMGMSLAADLKTLLDSTSHPNVNFSYSGMFNIWKYTDAYPGKEGYITSFYSGKAATQSQMNREHVWPDSRGGGVIDNDPHMTRPTLKSENSSRGNDFFNENASWDPNSFGVDKYRGIAARIIFYCAVKKYGTLSLVDKNTDSTANKTMGKLSTLLKWNLEYDIDETEILRNDVLYEKYNHNRNPFIDDRNYACRIWGNTNSTTKEICGMN